MRRVCAGLLKDSLRKYWLEQIRDMEASRAKAANKTPRELADFDSVCMQRLLRLSCDLAAVSL